MEGEIRRIGSREATEFILPRHYAGRIPSISYAFGWYVGGWLKAVVTYGKPASPPLCKGVCGDEWHQSVYELNRLIREDDFNQPLSHLVGWSLRYLKRYDIIIVSYSDTAMHHNGYIYQATNFIYTGQTVERTDIYSDGHSRHYDRADINNPIRTVRSAKNRYIYWCTRSKKLKRTWMEALRYPILPYPKEQNRNYVLGHYMGQTIENTDTGERWNKERERKEDPFRQITIYEWLREEQA